MPDASVTKSGSPKVCVNSLCDDIRKISFAFVDSVPAAVPVPVPDVLSCAVATTTSGTAPGIPGT